MPAPTITTLRIGRHGIGWGPAGPPARPAPRGDGTQSLNEDVPRTCGEIRRRRARDCCSRRGTRRSGRRDVRRAPSLGRPLEVTRAGDPEAPVRVLVVGSIHGNETAGHAVVARLRELEPPPGVQLWLVRTMNPDGALSARARTPAASTSTATSRSAGAAAGARSTPTSPGARPGERARDARDAAAGRGDRPGPDALLPPAHAARGARARRRQRRRCAPTRAASGCRRAGCPYYRGTATSWQNHRAPAATAFVVELPAGRLSRRAARRHARAVLGVAAARPPSDGRGGPKPPIEWDRIPFGARRRAQMRRYSRRHYGVAVARLIDPKVIVEHYTATSSSARPSTRSRPTRPTSSSASGPASARTS